ncbi:MAG: DUF1565 domain-containing protein [Lachnospira sp.]|nr:DUF1565 domain-containing protein [Lachnospira sp.]
MKLRIKRLIAWVLSVGMLLTVVPDVLVCVYATEDVWTIYVSGSGSDSNSGTSEAPVKTIEKALELVSAGGLINIVDSTMSAQPSSDEPLNIAKNIVISGGELTLSKAGIVLGADVTFKNVSLNFANPVRNAIIANGYTLTLEDVKGTGAYPVHLFCGEVTGYSGYGELPVSESKGEIVISGANNVLGDVYAGSLSEYGVANIWNGTSAITMATSAGGTIGSVYACGATEPRGTGDGESMTANSTDYRVTGDVNIELTGSKPSYIYGKTGGDTNADVIFAGGANAITNLNFSDLNSLTVNSGVLQPASLNNNPDIVIAAGAELDMSTVMPDGLTFTINNFTGNGILAMGQIDKLKINGEVTGTTVFQTTNNRPVDKSTSGVVEYGYPYIDVSGTLGSGSFVFTPYESQTGTTLTKVEDSTTAAWVTSEEPLATDVKPSSFDIPVTDYAVEEEEMNQSGLTVPVICEIGDMEYFSDVPLTITISKNGGAAVTATGEYSESYGYTYYASSLGFDEIYGTEDYGADDFSPLLCFVTYTSIESGVYTIDISVNLADGSTVTKTIKLTVGDVVVPPEAITTVLDCSYKEGSDKIAEVKLNGNVVQDVLYNDVSLNEEIEYVVQNNEIHLKASFLDNLSVGSYTFIVMYDSAGTVELKTTFVVEVSKAELVIEGATVTEREYDGTNYVQVTEVILSGIKGSDDVRVDMSDVKGTISGINVGTYNEVVLPELTLKGDDAGNYELTQPAKAVTATVNIKKAANPPNMPQSDMDVAYDIKVLGDVELPEGWDWSEAEEDTELEINKVANVAAVYTGNDKGNYENETVVIAVKRQAKRGDANNDDIVDIKDAVMLKQHLASMVTPIDTEAADLNEDGVVDIADAVKLMKILAGVVEE